MSEHRQHPRELAPPAEVFETSDSTEVFRAWISGGGLTVSLFPLAFPDVATWGLLLVDVARHVARGAEDQGEGTFDGNMQRIRAMFDAEIEHPTDLGSTKRRN